MTRGGATLNYLGDGTVIGDIRTAVTPDEVRMEWGDNYFFTIDRTTLRFKVGSHATPIPCTGPAASASGRTGSFKAEISERR